MGKNMVKGSVAVLLTGLTSCVALSSPETADPILNFFSEASQSQIAQAGFFFTIAAYIHAGRVKKEIKSNFESLALAIDRVAAAFRDDLKSHRERLDNLSERVASLESNNPKKE